MDAGSNGVWVCNILSLLDEHMALFMEIFSCPFLFPLFICRVGLVHLYCPLFLLFVSGLYRSLCLCTGWLNKVIECCKYIGYCHLEEIYIYTSKLGNEIGRLQKWNIDLPTEISLLTCKSWNYISELHSSWCKDGNEIQAFWRALVNQLLPLTDFELLALRIYERTPLMKLKK